MSNQVLNYSTDKDSTTCLGSLFQCLTAPRVKKRFFLCSSGISCILICTLCPVTPYFYEEFGSIFFTRCPHQVLIHIDRMPLSFLSSRLNSLSSLRLCPVSDAPVFVVLCWTCPESSYLSCIEEPRTAYNTPDFSHQC